MQESGAYAFGTRTTPPVELSNYFTCITWGLPHGSGWINEPVNYTKKMSIAGNTYNALKSMRGSKNWVEWHNNNPDLSILVTTVMSLLGENND